MSGALYKYYEPWFKSAIDVDVDPWSDGVDLVLIDDVKDFRDLFESFVNQDGPKELSVDTETTGLDPTQSEIIGYCLCFEPYTAYYLPVAHRVGQNLPQEIKPYVHEMMYQADVNYFFNTRFDLRMLREEGFYFDTQKSAGLPLEVQDDDSVVVPEKEVNRDRVHYLDGAILAYNADTHFGRYGPCSLKNIMSSIFGWELADIDPTKMKTMPPEDCYQYGALDALGTYYIPKKFEKIIAAAETPVRLDNEVLMAIMDMEDTPTRLDLDHFKHLKKKAQEEIDELEQEIFDYFGEEINFNSPKQVREALQSKGIDTGVETGTGKMSTSADALEGIADEHPSVNKIVESRSRKKFVSSFVEPFIEGYKPEIDGCRWSYHTTKADTGRLAGSDESSANSNENNDYFVSVNTQGVQKADEALHYLTSDKDHVFGHGMEKIPESGVEKYGEEELLDHPLVFETYELENSVRHGIRPHENCYWVCIDYSGQEMVIAANQSGDKKMLSMLKNDEDLHAHTRDNSLKPVDPDLDRGDAKVTNFTILFGGEEKALMESLGISKEKARQVRQEYLDTYPGLADYIEQQKKKPETQGYVQSSIGRFMWMDWMVDTGKWFLDKEYPKKGINSSIQSTGTELCKIALRDIWYNIQPDYENFAIHHAIHDECNFSFDRRFDVFLDQLDCVVDAMEIKLPGWEVPCGVDVEVGRSQGELIPLERDEDGDWAFCGVKDKKIKKIAS